MIFLKIGRENIENISQYFFQKFIKTFLFHILEYTYSIWYINYIRNNRPQGVGLENMVKETPLLRSPKFRGGFSILLHYLINENTNVSNARMNIPKAIKSLKSKCLLFISITSHSM